MHYNLGKTLTALCTCALLTACQTVSQSSTPAMYEIQTKMLDKVAEYCHSSSDQNNKSNRVQPMGEMKVSSDYSSPWVKLSVHDAVNRIWGEAYYNAGSDRIYCGAPGWRLSEAPKKWRVMNELDAMKITGWAK